MAIVVEQGITIGPGVTISSPPSAIKALLSPAGQAAYDAASTNAWFTVSAADYGNVKAGLSGTSTVGFTNFDISSANVAFSTNFGATVDQTNAAVATGNYVLGLVSRTSNGGSGTLTFRPQISTTFRGTYSAIGTGSLVMNSADTIFYWLRKDPTAAVGSTSYVALGVPDAGAGRGWRAGTQNGGVWGTGISGGAYSSNMTTWISFNSNIPAQQWLLTNTQQW